MFQVLVEVYAWFHTTLKGNKRTYFVNFKFHFHFFRKSRILCRASIIKMRFFMAFHNKLSRFGVKYLFFWHKNFNLAWTLQITLWVIDFPDIAFSSMQLMSVTRECCFIRLLLTMSNLGTFLMLRLEAKRMDRILPFKVNN